MKTIKIGLSKPRQWKPFSALIMWAYGTSYSHVFVKLSSKKLDRDLIYQASGTMVNFMSPIIFEDHNIIVKEFELQITDENYRKLLQFAIDNAGKPYGTKAVLGLAVVRLAEIFGRKIKNPFKDDGKTYVCSVLADYIIDNFTEIKSPGDWQDMSPLDIELFLESISNQI